MKKISLVTLLLAIAPLANAGPLNLDHIPADAKWLLHFDMEAARKWSLVEQWQSQMAENENYEKTSKMWAAKLGMNPMKDLLGVTIYDTQYAHHNGILLLHVQNINRKKLSAEFKKNHPDAKTETYQGHYLSTWTEMHGHRAGHDVTGCLFNDSLIVMSSDPHKVRQAIDVIDGDRETLRKDQKLLEGFDLTAILACRAIDVDAEYQQKTRCPVLARCQAATMSFAVRDNVMHLNYDLLANSSQLASKMKGAVMGMRAMMDLQAGENKQAQNLLKTLQIETQDERLLVEWHGESDAFHEVIQERMKKWPKGYKSGWKWHGHHKDKKHDRGHKPEHPDSTPPAKEAEDPVKTLKL